LDKNKRRAFHERRPAFESWDAVARILAGKRMELLCYIRRKRHLLDATSGGVGAEYDATEARFMSCPPKLHLIANLAPAQTLSQHRRNERIQADAFAIRAPVSGLLHHSLGHDRRQNFGPARGTSHCCSVTWGYRAGISRVSPHICAILKQLHEPRMERQT
jgi:hypothetical protein